MTFRSIAPTKLMHRSATGRCAAVLAVIAVVMSKRDAFQFSKGFLDSS